MKEKCGAHLRSFADLQGDSTMEKVVSDGNRARSMTEQQEPAEDTGLLSTQDLDPSKDDGTHGHFRFHLVEDLSYEDVKKCYRGSTVSKYNSQYHKLFQCVPKDEILMKVYSCALLRDILLQGRLYISRHWLCFYANLFGKDIKVAIPVVSVRLVKKHKTAGLVPNGLAITTDTGQKYVFVSLLSRDSVYDVLRRICTHLQVDGKSLSLKQFMEEPTLSLDEFPVPDEFPVVDEFPSVLKWRRKPSVVSVSSSLPDLLGNSGSGLGAADTVFKSEQPLEALSSSSSHPATWPSACAAWSSSSPSSVIQTGPFEKDNRCSPSLRQPPPLPLLRSHQLPGKPGGGGGGGQSMSPANCLILDRLLI
uniref:GRAM domain containing 2Aa n=1 Tax=Oryzias latipes TaxID=8090 RepID=A0A3P9JW40_ORYLA